MRRGRRPLAAAISDALTKVRPSSAKARQDWNGLELRPGIMARPLPSLHEKPAKSAQPAIVPISGEDTRSWIQSAGEPSTRPSVHRRQKHRRDGRRPHPRADLPGESLGEATSR